MKKIFALFSLIMLLSVTAAAEVVDLGKLVAGETYAIPAFVSVKAEYTPSETGQVKFDWSCNPIALYSSADCDSGSEVYGSHSYNNGHQIKSYESLEAGKTYYLYASMTIMAGELVIYEGDQKIEFLSISPSLDKPFSVSSDYRIYVYFNYPVTIGNSFLIAGGESTRIYPVISNSAVCCDVNSAVMDFYNRGLLNEGDNMTLRILQIKDAMNENNKYNETGRFEVEIPVAAKPAELTSTEGFSINGSNTLLSYYLASDDAARMKLTFDTDIDADITPVASLAYGNTDNLDLGIYQETLAGTVEDNTVTFDFSGKLRRRVDMLPGADADELPSDIYISFGNIYTPDGQRAYTGVLSNPAGFATSMTVSDLQYNIAADFVPARGTALTPGQEVEIWVMNAGLIDYDNICIDYTLNGETATLTIPEDEVREEDDEESPTGLDKLYYFTVPDYEADPESTVYVYMSNLICADGLSHTNDVRGNFKYSAQSSIAEIGVAAPADSAVYDLSGRRVVRPGRGIYISNGKKIFNQ